MKKVLVLFSLIAASCNAILAGLVLGLVILAGVGLAAENLRFEESGALKSNGIWCYYRGRSIQ